MAASLAYVTTVYAGSDGDATKVLYTRLEQLSPVGIIAVNLFRAQKNSARAKVYHGGLHGRGSYRSMAYNRKQWAIDNLCRVLSEHAEAFGRQWGWGVDDKQPYHRHVLYVELPTGQVSFHTEHRGQGPNAPRKWDGKREASTGRICLWVSQVLDACIVRESRSATA